MIDDKRAGRGVADAAVGLTPLLLYQCENSYSSKEQRRRRVVAI
jgi:hypothetical protein